MTLQTYLHGKVDRYLLFLQVLWLPFINFTMALVTFHPTV